MTLLPTNALHSISQSFQPRQLTLARELRWMLKHELAEKVGKSPSAIGQFESGRARPEPSTISAISLALGFPAPFFAREAAEQPIALEACHWRSLRSSTVREQRYILARGELLKELVCHLEQEVDFPPIQVPNIAPPASNDDDDIETCAIDARRAMGLRDGPIGNMVNELESIGIMVIPMDTDVRRVDAFSTWIGSRAYVFLNSFKGFSTRTRFDAAHELGHLIMHQDVAPGSAEIERQADRFASAFLMPKSSFSKECPRRLNFEHIAEIKQRWKVSYAAIIYRASSLGFFSANTVRRAFVEMNVRGIRLNEPFEPPPEPPQLLKTALEAALDVGDDGTLANAMAISRSELRALVEGRDLPTILPAT